MILKKLLAVLKRDGVLFTAKRILAFLVSHSPLATLFTFSFHKGLKLYFAPSMLTYVLFADASARLEDTEVINKFVNSGDTVVDVGAHIGSTVLVSALKAGANGQVIGIEASPKFYKILGRNISLNKEAPIAPIKIIWAALGDLDGVDVFLNEEVSDDTTNHISLSGTPVKQMTLDTLTNDLNKVDFLKIDVEGYEPQVLSGAINTLSKTKVIYIEFCTNNLQDKNTEQKIINDLTKHFSLFTFKNGELTPFTYNEEGVYAVNLICLRK